MAKKIENATKKVIIQKSIVASDYSYRPQQIAELDREIADKWIKCGSAKEIATTIEFETDDNE